MNINGNGTVINPPAQVQYKETARSDWRDGLMIFAGAPSIILDKQTKRPANWVRFRYRGEKTRIYNNQASLKKMSA